MLWLDVISKELYEKKSVAALCLVIDVGHELEFTYSGLECFISRHRAEKYVSLWIGENEQSFENMQELLETSDIEGDPLLKIWDNIKLGILF